MQTTVVVTQMNTGWLLKITSYTGDNEPMVSQFTFDNLIDTIEAATILRVHIDNNSVLPLKQYKQVG